MGFRQSKVEFGQMRSYSELSVLWLVLSLISGYKFTYTVVPETMMTELGLVISRSFLATPVWVLFCSTVLSADLN